MFMISHECKATTINALAIFFTMAIIGKLSLSICVYFFSAGDKDLEPYAIGPSGISGYFWDRIAEIW